MRKFALVLVASTALSWTAAYADDTAAPSDTAAPADAATADKEADPLAKQNFTGTLWLVTDYMFRGISNTRNHPAVQGELDWTYEGFYVSGWASNTEFSTAHLETDGYFGYRWSWSDLNFDAGGLYYGFPGGQNPSVNAFGKHTDVDYGEGKIGVSKNFDAPLSPAVGATVFVSPDFSGNDGLAEAVNGTLGLSLPYGINFGSGIGFQNVEGDQSSGKSQGILKPDGSLLDGYHYVWWNAGFNTDIRGFHLDLSYYDTADTDTLKTFYGSSTLFGGRVVFLLSRAF